MGNLAARSKKVETRAPAAFSLNRAARLEDPRASVNRDCAGLERHYVY